MLWAAQRGWLVFVAAAERRRLCPPNTSTLQLLHGAEGYLGIESEREEGKKAGGGMVS